MVLLLPHATINHSNRYLNCVFFKRLNRSKNLIGDDIHNVYWVGELADGFRRASVEETPPTKQTRSIRKDEG